MIVQKSLQDFAMDVSSNSFTPGGGCVSALGGSLGAALGAMVLRLTIGKKAYQEFETENTASLDSMLECTQALLRCVELDANGCNWIMEALAQPHDTEVEKVRRGQTLSEASKKANEAPIEVCRHSLKLLRLFKQGLGKVNRGAMSDWAVGAMHAYTALEGAAMNIKINMNSIDDVKYCRDHAENIRTILGEGRTLIRAIRGHVHSILDSSN